MSTVLHRGSPSTQLEGARPRVSVWLAITLLLAGVGSGIVLGRVTKPDPSPPPGVASAEVTTMITKQVAAVNSGDAARIAAFYAENATLTDIGNRFASPVTGRDEIAKVLAGDVKLLGPFLEKPGTVWQAGTFVAYAGSWGDVAGGVVVYELDVDGRILNQWAMHPAQ
jgi:hypothetical protein